MRRANKPQSFSAFMLENYRSGGHEEQARWSGFLRKLLIGGTFWRIL